MKQLKNLKSVVGKTIKSVDDSACNCTFITFTDGSKVMLEAENIGPPTGLIGIVAYEDEGK